VFLFEFSIKAKKDFVVPFNGAGKACFDVKKCTVSDGYQFHPSLLNSSNSTSVHPFNLLVVNDL